MQNKEIKILLFSPIKKLQIYIPNQWILAKILQNKEIKRL